MKYTVVRIKGNQYKVAQGDEILLGKLSEKKIEPEVLLTVNDGKVEVGQPALAKAKVLLEIMGDEKGKKLHVMKFRSKSRYRKRIGFRPSFTRVKVKKIN